MKKAQGLSMNIIVIAAIALFILVILIMIFTGRIGGFSRGVAECSSHSGVCAEECGVGTALNFPEEYPPASSACEDKNELKPFCCIPIQG